MYISVCFVQGLFKGSTAQGLETGTRPFPAERPKTLRRLKNAYDTSSGPKVDDVEEFVPKRPPASCSRSGGSGPGSGPCTDKGQSLSILSPFDEQEEWARISEIMASFGTGLVRESVFVSELEKEFQTRLGECSTPHKRIFKKCYFRLILCSAVPPYKESYKFSRDSFFRSQF
jgi:hypothetical protein